MRIFFCKKCGNPQIQSNGNGLDACGCGCEEFTETKPEKPTPVLAHEHKRSHEVAHKLWSLSQNDRWWLKRLRISGD